MSFRTEVCWPSVRNLMLFLWDSSLCLRCVQNDIVCHSERGRQADEESPTILARDSSVLCTSEWHCAVRPSTLGGRFFLPTVIRMTACCEGFNILSRILRCVTPKNDNVQWRGRWREYRSACQGIIKERAASKLWHSPAFLYKVYFIERRFLRLRELPELGFRS